MKSENLISICVPSYNGLEKLRVVLPELLRICETYQFQLCISDNGSTDGSSEYIQQKISSCEVLSKYYRYDETVDFRVNFETAIKLGDFKYHWLIGNDDLPIEKDIDKLVEFLNADSSDIVIINADKTNSTRVSGLTTTIGVTAEIMFAMIGSYVTWMSSFIVSHEMSGKADFSQYVNVFPPPAIAPLWASPSIPDARPLIISIPSSASILANSKAIFFP